MLTDNSNLFLRNSFYSIKTVEKDSQQGNFTVSILPDSKIFEGHFPGNPICPGVCNIEIIRECACLLTDKELNISSIKQCRFTTVVRPNECGELFVHVEMTEDASGCAYSVEASISDTGNTYVTFKGTMTYGS